MRKFWLIAGLCLFFVPSIRAAESNQFITVVNPVRISVYNPDPVASLKSQYSVISQYNLPATWLMTYDVLNRPEIVTEFKKFSFNQELGIFLEITPEFSKTAGVGYHYTGSWHFANAVFLSAYTQDERRKLIDTLFQKFEGDFGYYPKSVGSWWTDSYSLNYMQEKYGIRNNLACADQFSTDGYQLWGQYWSTPFYPTKYHTGVPAASLQDKLDVVNFQWAARDPLRGYADSTFSTQDYATRPRQDISYFEKLVKLYLAKNSNQFGQITVGLEGDFDSRIYAQDYRQQLQVVKRLMDSEQAAVSTMASFGDWYRSKFPGISPPQEITTDGATWYQSPYYRVGLIREKDRLEIRDLRFYPADLRDPYWDSPNAETTLHINLPSLIDKAQDGYSWVLPAGARVQTYTDKLVISGTNEVDNRVSRYPGINIARQTDNVTIRFPTRLPAGSVRGWDSESVYFFRQKLFPVLMLQGQGWNLLGRRSFYFSQDEQAALNKLASLPKGKVIVRSFHCLQCDWFGTVKPAAFANLRGYIGRTGGKPLVYATDLLDPGSKNRARQLADKARPGYIYLVKYGSYLEHLPYSPGDWGAKLIFENANAQIWEILSVK